MSELAEQAKRAIIAITGSQVELHARTELGVVPRFLLHRYGYMEVEVGKRRWLGLYVKRAHELRPAQVEKHLAMLSDLSYDGTVLLAKEMPYYIRQRLVERGIPFIVPNYQVFWPALGVSEKQYAKRGPVKEVELLAPASQVVAVHILLQGGTTPVHVQQLGKEIGFSAMTMTRAFNELTVTGAFSVRRQGKYRQLFPPSDRKKAWEQVKGYMRNPVRETLYLNETELVHDKGLIAGVSALARWSMLDTPEAPVYAVSGATWQAMSNKGLTRIPIPDDGTCALQIWRYDPALLGSNDCVDPFSLYLSLLENEDERVQSALDQLMRDYPW